MECEIGCDELEILKEKITSISSKIGQSGDCLTTFNPETNQLICSETMFGKLNDLSSNKVGENNELAGTETLFQLNYLIKDSLTSNVSQFGEETVFGRLNNLSKNKIGDCEDQSVCQILDQTSKILGTTLDDENSNSVYGKLTKIKTNTDLTPEIKTSTDRIGSSGSLTLFQKIADISCDNTKIDNIKTSTDKIGNAGIISGSSTLFERIAEVRTKTDLIGSINDNSSAETLFEELFKIQDLVGTISNDSSSNTLFDEIAGLPLTRCFIKVVARITGAMIDGTEDYCCGSPTFYDPLNGAFIASRDNNGDMANATLTAYNYITNPSNWTSFTC